MWKRNPGYYARRCSLQAATASGKDHTQMAEGNGISFEADITDLGDKIAALTITKAVQLKEYLKERYKIEPAAGGALGQRLELRHRRHGPRCQ
jgi:hypothetical protein